MKMVEARYWPIVSNGDSEKTGSIMYSRLLKRISTAKWLLQAHPATQAGSHTRCHIMSQTARIRHLVPSQYHDNQILPTYPPRFFFRFRYSIEIPTARGLDGTVDQLVPLAFGYPI